MDIMNPIELLPYSMGFYIMDMSKQPMFNYGASQGFECRHGVKVWDENGCRCLCPEEMVVIEDNCYPYVRGMFDVKVNQ